MSSADPSAGPIRNLGPGEVVKRRQVAWGGLLAAALLVAAVVILDLRREWRFAALLPLWIAALGHFQASAKT